MTLDDLRQSLTATEPPVGLTHALGGLWWDAKGDWTRAHESAQQDEGRGYAAEPAITAVGAAKAAALGVFHGMPTTKKSIFDLPTGPDNIVLYQKNIEAVCSSEAEVCEQVRLTIIHELGH
jgi:Zincin-like metallopeptidase